MNNFRHTGPSTSPGQTALRSGRNPANMMALLTFTLIATSAWHENVNAAGLGRLFFTPQQRQQLDMTGNSGNRQRNYIIVNGVVQKKGGKRTVWINGTAQEAVEDNENTPSTAPVTVPGKSNPVQLKVGQRLFLDSPATDEEK